MRERKRGREKERKREKNKESKKTKNLAASIYSIPNISLYFFLLLQLQLGLSAKHEIRTLNVSGNDDLKERSHAHRSGIVWMEKLGAANPARSDV